MVLQQGVDHQLGTLTEFSSFKIEAIRALAGLHEGKTCSQAFEELIILTVTGLLHPPSVDNYTLKTKPKYPQLQYQAFNTVHNP